MKTLFAAFLSIFILSSEVNAQVANDSIRLAITNMFTAMKNSDATSLRGCFADSAIFQTIIKNKEGVVTVKNESVAEFIDYISKQVAGNADERISFDMIKVDADLAVVWTPYKFYYKGQFSHCGANCFQLVRLNNVWKIQYLIDTRRRTGCE